MSVTRSAQQKREKFRELLRRKSLSVMPGGFSPLYARLAEAVGKIQAAIAARNELDPQFAICARCDAIGAEGGSFEDALERCIAYVRDGGADFVWLNSVETRDQLRRACAAIPAPVLTIW